MTISATAGRSLRPVARRQQDRLASTPVHMFVALVLWCVGTSGAAADLPRIAIIIDDLGYRHRLDDRAMSLPPEVAIAVVPGSPRARSLAREALTQAREVLVHLPMESMGGPHGLAPYAPIAISSTARPDELRRVVALALAEIPEARGVNNHMGSLLTQRVESMRWLMQALQCHRDTYFIDSYTTANSVALQAARQHGVPAARRDVFLDDNRDADAIAAEFRRLVAIARRDGHALAIGHPRRETLALLEHELARLEHHGVELVAPTDLLSTEILPTRSGEH